MASFSLTKDDDYASRKAAIARQEKLAEMLSQMGAQEQAVSTAGGITAPMSGMGALARGLTSFGGSYLSGKAAADAAGLTASDRANAMDLYKQAMGSPEVALGQGISQGAPTTGKYTLPLQMPDIGAGKGPVENVDIGMPTPGRFANTVTPAVAPLDMAGRRAAGMKALIGGEGGAATETMAKLLMQPPEIRNKGEYGDITTDSLTGEVLSSTPSNAKKTVPGHMIIGNRVRAINDDGTPGADLGPAPAGSNVTVKLPPGVNKADETIGEMYAKYITGDSASVSKNMNQLGMAINTMKAKPELFGNLSGALPIEIRSLFPGLKEGANVQQMVQDVVQTNLRVVLGPQFTAKEGEGLMKRILDPNQPTAVNLDRAMRLLKSVQEAAQAKQDAMSYFGQNNTIQGYKPKYGMVGSVDDILANAGLNVGYPSPANTPPPGNTSPPGTAEVWVRDPVTGKPRRK